MSAHNDASLLPAVERLLRSADYSTVRTELGTLTDCLVAESPFAILAVVESATWQSAKESASEAQAGLTRLAGLQRSAKLWDLYVLVLVREPLTDSTIVIQEEIENDTQFARKYVRAGLSSDADVLDRALRAFLPIRTGPQFDISEPLLLLREELGTLDLNESWVDAALSRFEETDEIEVD